MKRTIFPLYAPADEASVRPILDALRQKDVPVRDRKTAPRKGDALLVFLSGHLTASGPEADAFFRLSAGRELVIPVNLDGSAPSAEMQNALMARHALDGAKYGPEELAGRIERAVRGKSRLPLILSLLGLVALLAVAALILFSRAGQSCMGSAKPTATPAATATPAPTASPTATPPLPAEADLAFEELEKVHELIIVGDSFRYFTGDEEWIKGLGWARVGVEYVAYRTFENGAARWLSATDGHAFAMHDWGDLSFLPYMKNLMLLTLVNVQGTLPDLSGLKKLNCVELLDCAIPDISGVQGVSLINFGYNGPVMDFSPLNGIRWLSSVNMEIYGSANIDMASFGPTELRELRLTGRGDGRAIDLSGMKQCRKLERMELRSLPVADLGFLSMACPLGNVSLDDLPQLTSLNGLGGRPLLDTVNVSNCPRLRDLSALSACLGLANVRLTACPVRDLSFLEGASSLRRLELASLEQLTSFTGLEDHRSLRWLDGVELRNLRDLSALSGCDQLDSLTLADCLSLGDVGPAVRLPKLRDLQIYGSRLKDVNFLWDVQSKDYFSFGIAEVNDWSGLAAIERYSYLNITDHNGSALPYLKNATVTNLEIYNRTGMSNRNEGMDLSLLPHVTNELKLNCVRTLEGLDQPDLRRLFVKDCPYLSSLSGLEKLPKLVELHLCDCPRLNDWSALDGRKLEEMDLEALFSLPDFGSVSAKSISLTTIYDLKDLSCFAGYTRYGYNISLMDVDGVTDLSPLYHAHGYKLQIPAYLKDQAQIMVDSGLLDEYEVTYPEGWWEPIQPHVSLESLEEIDGLPSALLARVTKLTLAGDMILPEGGGVEEDYSSCPPDLYVSGIDRERVPMEPGTLTDLTVLSRLTGLEELEIYDQPQLASLAGIETLGSLRRLSVHRCPALADASAAFTIQSLEDLSLRFTAVTSIQGVQNLYALRRLHVNDSPVADLSPLADCSEELTDVNFHLPMMTFEQLKAQPALVLRSIHGLSIAGEYVFDGGPWWVEQDPPKLYLHNNDTDERLPVLDGPVTDLADLAAMMPNLDSLSLHNQPMTTLDGVEGLERLYRISISDCRQLTDISALGRIPSLSDISVTSTPLTSIQGIEDLTRLTGLYLSGTGVRDFSPLAQADLSYCVSEEYDGWGFSLALDVAVNAELSYADYAALEAIPVYWYLNMNNTRVDRWLDHVMGKEIHQLSCHSCGISNEQLKAFVQKHPKLEHLQLQWNPQLTDLSCLLELSDLREVYVTDNMKKAIASLGECGFELIIEN